MKVKDLKNTKITGKRVFFLMITATNLQQNELKY